MIILKKQTVHIHKEGGLLLIGFGKNRKIIFCAHTESIRWKDLRTNEKGEGKSILKYLGTMEKKRQIKGVKELNLCRVTLKGGMITESTNFSNEYTIKCARIVFP